MPDPTDLPPLNPRTFRRAAVGLGLFVVSVAVVLAFFPEVTGTDTFANVVALLAAAFAGVAALGVVYALLIQQGEFATQRRQLEVQSEELQLARAEYARSADAQEASAALLQEQVHLMTEAREERQRAAVEARQPNIIIAQQTMRFSADGKGASQFGTLEELTLTNRSQVSVGNVSYEGSEGLMFVAPGPRDQDYLIAESGLRVRVVKDHLVRQPGSVTLRVNYDDQAGERHWQEFHLDLLQSRARLVRTSYSAETDAG